MMCALPHPHLLSTTPLLPVTLPSGLPGAARLITLQFQFVRLGPAQQLQESGRGQFRMPTSSLHTTAAGGGGTAKVTVNLTSDLITHYAITKNSKLQTLNSIRKIINHSGWLLVGESGQGKGLLTSRISRFSPAALCIRNNLLPSTCHFWYHNDNLFFSWFKSFSCTECLPLT